MYSTKEESDCQLLIPHPENSQSKSFSVIIPELFYNRKCTIEAVSEVRKFLPRPLPSREWSNKLLGQPHIIVYFTLKYMLRN